jgi:hypothetical protein
LAFHVDGAQQRNGKISLPSAKDFAAAESTGGGIKTYYCSRAPSPYPDPPGAKFEREKALRSESGTVALNIKSFDASLATFKSHVCKIYTPPADSNIAQCLNAGLNAGSSFFHPLKTFNRCHQCKNIFLKQKKKTTSWVKKYAFLQQV